MLVISRNQIGVFESTAFYRFEDKMISHSKVFAPNLCKTLSDEQLRLAIREGMERAETYGFTDKGPVRLYLELMLLYGSHFDTDPQYPMWAEILKGSDDQMTRAERIYQRVLDYQEKVSGIDAVNDCKALEHLASFARKPVELTASSFEAKVVDEMVSAFPQKAAYVGQKALINLIRSSRKLAKKYKFPHLRSEALMAVLMFAFGHGCHHDPLYTWIGRTLNDEKIVSPEGRVERLEKKSLIWLDRVLSNLWKGEEA